MFCFSFAGSRFVNNKVPYLASLIVLSLLTLRCTTKGQPQADATDPIKAESASAPTAEGDQSLPPELRDAHSFDPATTLDPSIVQESDFYKVKREAEGSKAKLDEEWKAQDEQEKALLKIKEEEEKRRQEELKKEEERKEESRKRSINEYKQYASERVRNERRAAELVKKMPTISKADTEWNGLE